MTSSRGILALWAVLLLPLIALSLPQAQRTGDGEHYLLTAAAFAAHATPGVTIADLDEARGALTKGAPAFRQHVMALRCRSNEPRTAAALAANAGSDASDPASCPSVRLDVGWTQGPDTPWYSVHFWTYPALVAPFLWITGGLGLPAPRAFALCNWALILATLAYVAFAWRATLLQKNVLAALFLLSGTTYYAWWTCPEVFTASMVLLALMLADDGRPDRAMLCAALASTQNPPVLVLCGLLGCSWCWKLFSARREHGSFGSFARSHRATFAWVVAATLVAVTPPLFYLYTVGVPNPIIAAGCTDRSLIGLARLQSIFLDPNIGVIAANPGLILGVASVLVISAFGAASARDPKALTRLGRTVFLLAAAAAMALPALITTNWNQGHSVLGRYAYWLSMPIAFAVASSFATLPRRTVHGIAALVVGLQVAAVLHYGVWGKNARSDYLVLKPAARFLLRRFPQFYNPIPEIFVERLVHREGMPTADGPEARVFRFPEKGAPTKLLVPARWMRFLDPACKPIAVTPVEGDWVYVSLRAGEKCGVELPAVAP
jgi:hypothetical protein